MLSVGRLDIHTTPARLDFNTQPAKLDLRQPPASFTLAREKGGVDVQVQHPQLIIDSSACQAEEGSESVLDFVADTARQGIEDAQAGASRLNEEGISILKNFHSGSHIIADIARNKAIPGLRQLAMKFIPFQPPQVSFTDNEFDMTVTPDQVTVNWDVHPTADVELSQQSGLQIRMAQYPSITIDYIPPQLDTTA